MVQLTPSAHAASLPPVSRRVLVIAIGLLVAVHSVLVTIWVQPPNPFREAIGEDNLEAYINNPVISFEQSWSVFAPTPRRAGENVLVRAYVGTPGEAGTRVTDWFDITRDEDRRITHVVNPSRIHSATRRLGGDLNAAFSAMNARQRQAVAADLAASPRAELGASLRTANTRGKAGQETIRSYLLNDEMLTRFGSMYAIALWGADVNAVEFRIGHRRVPSFTRRHDVDLRDVPFDYNTIGVRQVIRGSADAQRAFDRYVRQAPDTRRLP